MIGATSVPVITGYARKLDLVAKARLPVKTARKNESSYVHRLGYYSLVSNYTGGNSVHRLSGSSINRKIREREKMERSGIDKRTGKHIGLSENGATVAGKPDYRAVPAFYSSAEINRLLSKQSLPDAPRGNLHKTFKFDNRTDKLFSGTLRKKVRKIRNFSSRSKSKVKARATAFYRAVTGKRSKIFCTLTFINDVTDQLAVKILNKFLTVLRKGNKKLQYMWVAERQMKNTGRIHFHLIINMFLPIKKINSLWVLQQYNAGIEAHGISAREINQRYEKGTIGEVFNPVDVKRVRNIGMLSSYLSKYISKGNNEGGFDCLTWHCSRGVSRLFDRTLVGYEAHSLARSEENCKVDKRTGEFFGMPEPVREKKGGKFFYTIWYINQPGRFLCFLREMEQLNKWIMDGSASVGDVIEYLGDGVDDEKYRRHFLN